MDIMTAIQHIQLCIVDIAPYIRFVAKAIAVSTIGFICLTFVWLTISKIYNKFMNTVSTLADKAPHDKEK